MELNIVVVGVGGQGILTLSSIIAEACVREGVNVLVAETHGLSQRGGSVIVHVRIGDVEAPLVPLGEADLMLSMELIEAARYANYLKPGAHIVANDYIVPPIPQTKYPSREAITKTLSTRYKLDLVPATKKALELGDPRTANMILLGYAIGKNLIPLNMETVERVVEEKFGKSSHKNLEALKLGIQLAKRSS
ncbi:MAG TPA: indolepyruvate ferredoxin oxidoreductase [Pyrodictium sp.]|nr:indolepyruvate ferredoxin oxidoreductase [Pyrodictium sp.]